MLQELVSSESESGRYCAGIAAVPDWQAQVRTGLRSFPIPLGGAVEDALEALASGAVPLAADNIVFFKKLSGRSQLERRQFFNTYR
jgi:hypothetical protein